MFRLTAVIQEMWGCLTRQGALVVGTFAAYWLIRHLCVLWWGYRSSSIWWGLPIGFGIPLDLLFLFVWIQILLHAVRNQHVAFVAYLKIRPIRLLKFFLTMTPLLIGHNVFWGCVFTFLVFVLGFYPLSSSC